MAVLWHRSAAEEGSGSIESQSSKAASSRMGPAWAIVDGRSVGCLTAGYYDIRMLRA